MSKRIELELLRALRGGAVPPILGPTFRHALDMGRVAVSTSGQPSITPAGVLWLAVEDLRAERVSAAQRPGHRSMREAVRTVRGVRRAA